MGADDEDYPEYYQEEYYYDDDNTDYDQVVNFNAAKLETGGGFNFGVNKGLFNPGGL